MPRVDVAITSVISSSIIGVVAVIAPVWSRASERRHEKASRIRDERARAYEHLIRIIGKLLEGDEDGAMDHLNDGHASAWLWGSVEVRELFNAWVELHPEGFTSEEEEEDEPRRVARRAVLQRMSDEIQGRVTIH